MKWRIIISLQILFQHNALNIFISNYIHTLPIFDQQITYKPISNERYTSYNSTAKG
jgi:hypothetical protein